MSVVSLQNCQLEIYCRKLMYNKLIRAQLRNTSFSHSAEIIKSITSTKYPNDIQICMCVLTGINIT